MTKLTVTLAFLGLAACGGGGSSGVDAATSADAAPTGIGPAGGTVMISGAKVVIPAGALATMTPIAIAMATPASLAPLPLGSSGVGQPFAFTPHGTMFAMPVTIEIDHASGPPVTVMRLDNEADTSWAQAGGVTDMGTKVSIASSTFSVLWVTTSQGAQ